MKFENLVESGGMAKEIIQNGEVTLKHITAYDNAAERMVNLVPDMFDKVTGFINRNK